MVKLSLKQKKKRALYYKEYAKNRRKESISVVLSLPDKLGTLLTDTCTANDTDKQNLFFKLAINYVQDFGNEESKKELIELMPELKEHKRWGCFMERLNLNVDA